jgi:hypothetical protein
MCAIEGYNSISGLTNDEYENSDPFIVTFSSVEIAHNFKKSVDCYFSSEILQNLKLKKKKQKNN